MYSFTITPYFLFPIFQPLTPTSQWHWTQAYFRISKSTEKYYNEENGLLPILLSKIHKVYTVLDLYFGQVGFASMTIEDVISIFGCD